MASVIPEDVRRLLAAAEAGCCDRLGPALDRLLPGKLAELDEGIAEMHAPASVVAAAQVVVRAPRVVKPWPAGCRKAPGTELERTS
jgi:hypothetical protein